MDLYLRDIPKWAEKYGLAGRICAARGIPEEDLGYFLDPLHIEKKIHPQEEFPEIFQAALFLRSCILDHKRTLIWGDYDADGIMASAIMEDLLTGRTEFLVHIPERSDGYGIKLKKLQELCDEFSPELLLSVDCGITACREVAFAKERNIRVLVTDHHLRAENLPDADCIVDPIFQKSGKYKYMCGAGVAWLLANLTENNLQDGMVKNRFLWTVYAGIATVADVVPLGHMDDVPWNVNRFIVRKALAGLQKIAEKPELHKGLATLLGINKRMQVQVPSSFISFSMAPCINASGRMSSPMHAYEMVTRKSVVKAEDCITLNGLRKKQEAETLASLLDVARLQRSVLVARVNIGILGLLAGRMTEKRGKPTIVLTKIGNVFQGSGRAPEGYHLLNLLKQCRHLLIGFGGHARAAGCSLAQDNLGEFRRLFSDLVDAVPRPEENIYADAELQCEDITCQTLQELSDLEPFGNGNPEPVFYVRNCTVINPQLRGAASQHLLFKIVIDGKELYGKAWNARQYYDLVKKQPQQDILCHLTEPFGDRIQPEIEVLYFLNDLNETEKKP